MLSAIFVQFSMPLDIHVYYFPPVLSQATLSKLRGKDIMLYWTWCKGVYHRNSIFETKLGHPRSHEKKIGARPSLMTNQD